MTGETRIVRSLRGRGPGLLQVARSAFFFQNGMRFREPPAAINARVFKNSPFSDPNECQERQQHAEPEFRTLQRRRSLEIIQVDALRQFFRCPCACHDVLLVAQRHHRMHRAKQNQRERKRNMHQQPSMQPVMQPRLPLKLPRLIANVREIVESHARRSR
jgi:hypothetical protein